MKIILVVLILLNINVIYANEDSRVFVKMPKMMQDHMMLNMRDHLKAIDEILKHMANEEFSKAADISEKRLGMSSLHNHGASHMAKVMPKEMASIGTSMHRAASRFALKVEEDDLNASVKALSEITTSCVACHQGYRIK